MPALPSIIHNWFTKISQPTQCDQHCLQTLSHSQNKTIFYVLNVIRGYSRGGSGFFGGWSGRIGELYKRYPHSFLQIFILYLFIPFAWICLNVVTIELMNIVTYTLKKTIHLFL